MSIPCKDAKTGWSYDDPLKWDINWVKSKSNVQKVQLKFKDTYWDTPAQIADLKIYYCRN